MQKVLTHPPHDARIASCNHLQDAYAPYIPHSNSSTLNFYVLAILLDCFRTCRRKSCYPPLSLLALAWR